MNRERQIMILVVVFVLAMLFGIGMPRLPAIEAGVNGPGNGNVPSYVPP